MTDALTLILQRSNSAISKVAAKSAVNPILWLSALISLPLCALAAFTDPPLKWIFVGIGSIPILLTCVGFIYFMLKKPDYLRSEKFHIQKYSLEYLGEKGKEIPITADHLIAMSKPNSLIEVEKDREDQD